MLTTYNSTYKTTNIKIPQPTTQMSQYLISTRPVLSKRSSIYQRHIPMYLRDLSSHNLMLAYQNMFQTTARDNSNLERCV